LVHASTKVHDRAGGGVRLGTLAIGTRLGWRQVAASKDRCGAWLELPAGGWVCARELAPSDDLPAASPQPTFTPEQLSDQGHVRKGEADGAASSFAGLDLAATPPPRWPFGWVVADDGHPDVVIRAAPTPTGAALVRLPPRAIVPILEVVGAFARIGDGVFVPRAQIRIARRTVRPDGVDPDERWLDVDLDEQVLIAYDGDQPRYATMISSGRPATGTPTGTHRITEKHAMITMSSPPGWPILWDVPRVPWSMTYRKNFAVHGAYWHDGYGERRSHGCVNLAPRDARFIYQFTSPPVPDGWVEVRGNGRGSVVRIRDKHHPAPAWLDLDGLPLPRGGYLPSSRLITASAASSISWPR
jgi:lipoprotein-anchoring transpeptidase ErfK/SrfK